MINVDDYFLPHNIILKILACMHDVTHLLAIGGAYINNITTFHYDTPLYVIVM